ncbi:MAG TPA: DEAD/DEAH box helicase [Myxococcota bacterium]|nr:DEAD/DEAH box helicase [Myxococcota bacterium]HJO24095.1 DEAD/DEAH box helicase [Myxococcota bacterium]
MDLSEPFQSLDDPIRRSISELGWTSPTPVQEKVLPAMRTGRDLIVQAHTGSGKTGAFGIPIAEALDPEANHCQALVLVPTRELANQVAEETAILAKHKGLRCLAVYGGVGYQHQIDAFEAGAHLVVGTPGRILDHLGSGRFDLGKLRILIFDEADEMLSLGFWPDMREIQRYVPKKRQTCLFSATIPERVRSLARSFLIDPEYVSLSEGQLGPQQIEHYYVVTTAQEKETTLVRILEHDEPDSAIVFCNTKADVRYVTAFLQRRGFDADQISGDLTQAAREEAMGRIKSGKLRFLVATDVAARGIDISDLSHVISYAAPESPEVYVHRTGRTGRAGKAGVAISLVSGLDIGNFRYLQQVNRIEISEREVPKEETLRERLRERLMVKIEREVRALPEKEQRFLVQRFVPIVNELAASEDGRGDLAAICAAYMREHKPEVRVTDTPPHGSSDPEARQSRHGNDERPRRRRRGRKRGGTGASS